jgi:hypothetical protein
MFWKDALLGSSTPQRVYGAQKAREINYQLN